MRYTLICSASGTGLSRSVENLRGRQKNLLAEDVETRLCSSPKPWNLPAFRGVDLGARSMKDVCSKLPRKAISLYWRDALSKSLQALERADDARALALACHLTLFTPHRREFFVPGRPQDFLEAGSGRAHEVARVVVLIDDIYDMYARLSGPGDVFNELRQTKNYNDWVRMLSGQSLLDPETGSPELLRLEVRRRLLESLAAWRRAELVQAEALAGALGGVPLTVLGVKHRLSALESLVLRPETRAVYLSHKITDARLFNKDNPGNWPSFVMEVNSLSGPFQDLDIVLLHPTAIDELRTASSKRRIGLTDRWPLQVSNEDPLIYSKPDYDGAPEYSKLLGQYDFEKEGTREQAIAVFRGFELGVFHEIATRDHLLVSSSDGLVLYRPVADNGKHSSGARDEVSHWLQRWIHERNHEPSESAPRLVAMLTFEDITLRLARLTRMERSELYNRIVEALQEQGFDREAAESMVDGTDPPSQHLHELHGAEHIARELEHAAGVALIHCFLSWLANVRPSEGREGAALVARESAEQLRSPETAALVAELLEGGKNAVETTGDHIAIYAQASEHDTLTTLARSLVADLKAARS